MSFSVYIPNPRQRTIMLLDLTAVLRFIFFLLVGCCEWKLGNQYEKNRSFSLALRQHWLLHRDHLWDITATMSFFFLFFLVCFQFVWRYYNIYNKVTVRLRKPTCSATSSKQRLKVSPNSIAYTLCSLISVQTLFFSPCRKEKNQCEKRLKL